MTNKCTDPILAQAMQVLQAESQAVLNVIDHLDDRFQLAVEAIIACTGTLIVAGVGKSGIIGQKISATFASTGTPSHFLHPTEALHGDLGRIRANDLVLLLSYGGETEEALSLAALVRQDGVKVISMTGQPESHLARISDIHLSIGDVTEACPHNLAPTTSTTATLALGDALAMVVSSKRQFTADDFAKRHPGGSLGRQMMPLTEMLRFKVGENLSLISDTLTVEQVLKEAASNRRAGAVLLVNPKGQLSGIFTDGDLRRLLIEHGPDALCLSITQVMTANPRRLTAQQLVRDAVQLVREYRLDEIPIVDDNDKPVGLIDVQDLISLKVIQE